MKFVICILKFLLLEMIVCKNHFPLFWKRKKKTHKKANNPAPLKNKHTKNNNNNTHTHTHTHTHTLTHTDTDTNTDKLTHKISK